MRQFCCVTNLLFLGVVACAAMAVDPHKGTPGEPPAKPSAKPAPTSPAEPPAAQPNLPAADPKWLERMPKEDRAAIEEMLGFAPPPLGQNLQWFNGEPTDWGKLLGRVVVVQSWTTGNTAGRTWPTRVANALKGVNADDLRIIALHTPENAATAEEFMKRQKPPENVTIAIDSTGETCDALGIYKHPVNFVVDRNGMVRYAGLNLNGLEKAVAELVQQPFDKANIAKPRASEKPAETGKPPAFPAIKGGVGGATDLRGKPAPEFAIEQWYTREPSPQGKVVVIAFFSVDDRPAFSAHRSLNDIASRYGENVCVTAISSDSRSNFETEAMKEHIDKSDFKYAVALDRKRTMANAMAVTTTPYMIVMSKDWVVRWQGRPEMLRPDVLEDILKADAASSPGTGGKPDQGGKRRGWTSGGKSS